MQIHASIQIRPGDGHADSGVNFIRCFCRDRQIFKFDEEKSCEYAQTIGCTACQVIALPEAAEHLSALCFAGRILKTGAEVLELVNIIPLKQSELSLKAYNHIAHNFTKHARNFNRHLKKEVSIHFNDGRLALKDIVPGKRCREFLRDYIDVQSTAFGRFSYHPLDTERLDTFICALSQYGGSVCPSQIRAYLIADLGWEVQHAKWVEQRIAMGLQVLEVKRKF